MSNNAMFLSFKDIWWDETLKKMTSTALSILTCGNVEGGDAFLECWCRKSGENTG